MLGGTNKNFPEENKSTLQKVLETGPAVIATICLIISFITEDSTLKMVLLIIAAAIGVVVFLFMLIREIVQRIKRRNKKY